MSADRARRRAERWIAAAFGLTVLAAVGLAVVYVLGGQVQLEGVLLGLAFAGLGVGLAAWARHLLPQGPYVEEREPMVPAPSARAAFESELDRDDAPLVASGLPRRMLVLALGTLGAVALLPLRSLLFRGPRPANALGSTAWQGGSRVVREDGTPVRPEDLVPGSLLTVFPAGHTDDGDVATLLIRVDPQALDLPPARRAWTVDGLVAYSKLCTHAGCPVGLYTQGTGQLLCPCHQSVFDLLAGAVPIQGPAARPLPQLPLGVAPDGSLVARGGFSAPVGAAYWRRS